MSNKVKTIKMNQSKQELVPRLRFPEFKDNVAWEEKPLQNFLKESRIKGSSGDVAKKITVKLWGKGVFEKKEALKGSVNTRYFQRKSGQFIYSKLDFLNQAFGIVPDYLDKFESTVDLPCFDIAKELNSVFLLEYVKRKSFYKTLGETADGSRKARRIHADTFLSFPIIAPPRPEQQKIADCLSSIDDLITAESEKLESIKNHKKGLMQNLFPRDGKTTPNFRFPEFNDDGDWEETILGNHCKITTGKLDANAMVENGQYRFYTCAKEYYLIDKYAFDTDALLVSGNGANVGYIHYYKGKFNAYQRTYVLDQFSQDIFFIKYYLERNLHKRIATEKKEGNTPYIVISALIDMIVALPKNKKEQQKIADCLSSVDDLITSQTQKIEALKTHKKGLMQQLFPNTEQSHKSK